GEPEAESSYVVRVADGALVKIAADQVGRVVETTTAEQNYAKLLPRMPDSADGHAKMAQWCHEQGLTTQKDFHWQHVLRHDPDHAEARRALGYSRIRGEWMRPDEFKARQGYQRYKGQWRLP